MTRSRSEPREDGAADPARRVWDEARRNLEWLREHVPSALSGTMQGDAEAVASLAMGLSRLRRDRQVVVADRADELILARLDVPGSVLETLRRLDDREIPFAELSHSAEAVPGTGRRLELQRFRFDARSDALVAQAGDPGAPDDVRRRIREAVARLGRPLDAGERDELFRILWLNDRRFVAGAPPLQVARFLWLLHALRLGAGFVLEVEEAEPGSGAAGEATILFAVESPPQRGYLAQVIEVLDGLEVGVRGSQTATVYTGNGPCFLGSFRVAHRRGAPLDRDSEVVRRMRRQLYNTQILATDTPAYRELVLAGILTGEEASLVNALIGFCHTSCAHNQPHRYTHEDVVRAFQSHPDVSLRLVRLFEARFDPAIVDREALYAAALADAERDLAAYNTGHRLLDEFRRSLFQTALTFVRHTLKTNFYVPEKRALAFRLDPAYLEALGTAFTADLPRERPFRVTYFHGRSGLGYHIGFSDIARGGWRTIVTRTRDDYVTAANGVFRETYVLAHTQHLKNKDIYEGGSKLVALLHAPCAETRTQLDQQLHKLQQAFASAFLDVFVTQRGRAADPRVVDYYGADEPIELGPDENMHDEVIETIAELSIRRGYVLGAGIMSSKKVGINHKQYGVTSTGVLTFAEIALREIGVDARKDRFTVKLTGGPNGDVAGNFLHLLLERCPRAEVRLVVDGTAALFDPNGLDRRALAGVVLKADADAFDPARLSPGGFLLYRSVRRTEGLRELHRRVERTATGVREDWRSLDEFHEEYDTLAFTVPADLFVPAGGRPETIDAASWRRFLAPDGAPTARVIVEGANSFLTPEARQRLQEAGVVLLRDAAANKCGVISSSYEIIGNLLLSDREFLANKEAYVKGVLEILERRAADEANLIFRRRREEGERRTFTEISDALGVEMNGHKERLFAFFEARPELWRSPLYRRVLLSHLPRLVRETPRLRRRIARLPPKYRSAILAAEIACAMVYRSAFDAGSKEGLERYVARAYPASA